MYPLDKENYGYFNEITSQINAVVTPLDLDASLDAQAYEQASFEASTRILAPHVASDIPEPVLDALLDWSLESGGPGPGVARALVDAGARVGDDVYIFDSDIRGPEPLMHVVAGTSNRWDPRQLLRRLVEAGADVNLANDNGSTPLHTAVCCRDGGKTVATLVELGANIDAQEQRGRTALHWAVLGRYPDSTAILLEAGADTSIQDENGKTAWDIIRERNNRNAPAIREVFRAHARKERLRESTESLQRGLQTLDVQQSGPTL